ncbi:MAG: TVP38/TMEM64 family protein [Gammaproteobacteria bacterium]|nr:MAG: TVP38/TMEM64 family protein [Gammaproteobacteria bacterium]
MRPNFKAVFFAVVFLASLLAVTVLPIQSWLVAGTQWIETHRMFAWAAYVGTYIVVTVLVMPGSVLTVVAGFVFGLPVGVALVSAGSVLGAVSAFLVGRFFAREWVAQRIVKLPRLRALDMATHHEGFTIVFLTRLSPVFPFNLLNYAFGLTAVRLRDYFLASWIGMLPGTILYVYIGSVAKDLTELTSGDIQTGMAGRLLLLVGLAATLILTILITRKATRILNAHLERELAGAGEP